jgi:hypothetical protein
VCRLQGLWALPVSESRRAGVAVRLDEFRPHNISFDQVLAPFPSAVNFEPNRRNSKGHGQVGRASRRLPSSNQCVERGVGEVGPSLGPGPHAGTIHAHARIRRAICGSATVMCGVAPCFGRMESSRIFPRLPELRQVHVALCLVPSRPPARVHRTHIVRGMFSFSILPLIAPWNSSSATMFVAGGRGSPVRGA